MPAQHTLDREIFLRPSSLERVKDPRSPRRNLHSSHPSTHHTLYNGCLRRCRSLPQGARRRRADEYSRRQPRVVGRYLFAEIVTAKNQIHLLPAGCWEEGKGPLSSFSGSLRGARQRRPWCRSYRAVTHPLTIRNLLPCLLCLAQVEFRGSSAGLKRGKTVKVCDVQVPPPTPPPHYKRALCAFTFFSLCKWRKSVPIRVLGSPRRRDDSTPRQPTRRSPRAHRPPFPADAGCRRQHRHRSEDKGGPQRIRQNWCASSCAIGPFLAV